MKTKCALFLFLASAHVAVAQLTPRAAFDYFAGGYDVKVVENRYYLGTQYENQIIIPHGEFRARVGADYRFKNVSVFFDQHIYMLKAQNITFQPLQATWFAGIEYHFTNEIKLKYEHMCTHSVITDGSANTQIKMYGGYNMFSISYGY